MLLDKINSPSDLKKLSLKELKELAKEIREVIIQTTSQRGGHLASNLGVVELTLAIHYCFEAPKDKIIWDVSHQTYTHKLITGRYKKFHTLRSLGGISGFLNKDESEYDEFCIGHASTSLSLALGLAIARDLNKQGYKVVAVIGDGALGGGLALEALNHAGHLKNNLIIILNNNEMSISKTEGALAKHINKLITQPLYVELEKKIDDFLNALPIVGKEVGSIFKKIKESIKNLVLKGSIIFEELGFKYIGPIDGHDLGLLISTFKRIKKLKKNILVHVFTKKGKGYAPAEKYPERFHGTLPFDIKTGKPKVQEKDTFSGRLGDVVVRLAKENPKIVGITAAMPHGTGLYKLKEKFPERFFDVGICEEHAVSLAAGLAKAGLIPIVCIYSTFLQRAYDQIVHDVCLNNLKVIFAIDRAGLVGEDGKTHHGLFDIAYLRHIPNIVLLAPKDPNEFEAMLEFSVYKINSPCAIRYPKQSLPCAFENNQPIEFGKWQEIKKATDIVILAMGRLVSLAKLAIDEIKDIDIGLYNARFIKPLDEEVLEKIKDKFIITLEEGILEGGFGSAVLEWYNNKGIEVKLKRRGFLNFVEHGSVDELFKKYKLDKEGIKEIINESRRI